MQSSSDHSVLCTYNAHYTVHINAHITYTEKNANQLYMKFILFLFESSSIFLLCWNYYERKFFYISQKKLRLYVCLSENLGKILPNTLIYESILIKIYVNTNIMNTQIFNFNNYDLKDHWRSQKVIWLSGNLRKVFLTHSFMNRFW